MKKGSIIIVLGLLFLFPSFVLSQADKVLEQILDKFAPRGRTEEERPAPQIRADDLRVLQLEMSPDPVRQGQWASFHATISNLSHRPGRVSLLVKDRDEVITEVKDILLQSGHNRISFPQTYYRFSRSDHCFTIEVDIERTKRPIDLVQEFCARRTQQGWTLTEVGVGPFFVEELEMIPDPVSPGQEVRFRVRIRNGGRPCRADIQIQDRDQVVVRLDNVSVPRGYVEYQFPNTRYLFQRFDHCFTVVVDVERTPYRIDSAREFCAKPLGWTLRP